MSRVAITGGAGFVGTNLADRLAREGYDVTVFDNLSRPGVEANLRWLVEEHGERIRPVIGDIRDAQAVAGALADAEGVFHLAAQVAVTTSLEHPREDFFVNALGALNVLEAVRARPHPPLTFFTSTHKVYGALPDVPLEETETRYRPLSEELRARGIDELRPLDFHSPFGCSKGAADQYVHDYARSFGIPTVVFRMSCSYGPHQFGNEDQGWVAHFLIRALEEQPIILYGDGKQVRDVLYVTDLVEAFLEALQHPERVAGQVFNVGGGPERSLSLLELLALIERLTGRRPRVEHQPWRTGDQKLYVSDNSRLESTLGWRPQVPVEAGVARLCGWLARTRGYRLGPSPVEAARALALEEAAP